jgi:cold shock CspA family protein
MSRKLIAIDNHTDDKKYDISVQAIAPSILRQLREGSEVSVSAVFDGNGYDARSVETRDMKSDQ